MKMFSFALATTFVARAAVAQSNPSPMPAVLDRADLQRAVLARHPEVRAAEALAIAAHADVDASGRLPPPEGMVQVWQIPFEKPYAVDRAGMVMVGVTQRFPAPGSLGPMEEAKKSEAAAASVMISDRARMVQRDAGHAYVDYAEAAIRRQLHADHERVERRILELARARHATGGALADAVRAEAELARTQADLTADVTLERTARSQLNVLLGQPLDAKLPPPRAPEARVPREPAPSLVKRAIASRPEPKARAHEAEAKAHEAESARREASVPSFALSALYFPPTGAMTSHSYGASASVELPWLWGGASSRARASEARARAAASARGASELPIEIEVVNAHATVSRAAERLRVLERRALPAGRRAVDVATAAYESGGPLMNVLEARRMLVDLEMQIVEARTMLEHALVDLEAAVGAAVPTQPLGDTRDGEEAHHGG